MTNSKRTASSTGLAVMLIFLSRAEADSLHTPAAGSEERNAIMAALHAEYTTGSGSAVKFQVKHFRVHNGWAWINVVPLNPKGEIEGEEWPSLLEEKEGKWTIIDLIKVAADLDDPVGPMDPSEKFLREVQKRYPAVPADIFPKRNANEAE